MNPNMNDDELDRVLSETGEIVPSSGFVAFVMDAVHQEDATPAPIPFPWKWALPGLIVSLGLVVFFFVRFAHAGMRAGYDAAAGMRVESLLSMPPQRLAAAPIFLGIEWSALALLVSFVVVRLSMRISTSGE